MVGFEGFGLLRFHHFQFAFKVEIEDSFDEFQNGGDEEEDSEGESKQSLCSVSRHEQTTFLIRFEKLAQFLVESQSVFGLGSLDLVLSGKEEVQVKQVESETG